MKKTIRIIGNVLALLSVAFIAKTLFSMKMDLGFIKSWPLIILTVILESVFSMIAIFVLALAWNNTISFFSTKPYNTKEALKVYMKANIGKYLPGNVAHFVERNIFASNLGLSQLDITASTFLEIVGMVVTALVISLFMAKSDLFYILSTSINTRFIICAIGITIILCVVAFLLIVKIPEVRYAIQKMCSFAFLHTMAVNFVLYMFFYVLLGIMLLTIITILNEALPGLSTCKSLFSSFIISYLAGFIMPGAPGGMGVREFVMSLLTKNTNMADIVIVAIVIQRIVSILGDVEGYIWSRIAK